MQAQPPLKIEWPIFTNDSERLEWYAAAIVTHLQHWDEQASKASFTPTSEATLVRLEKALGCPLPGALRQYHLTFGVSKLAETINVPDIDDDYGIKPLLDAYPGIVDMNLPKSDLKLARQLIAFGDYLGNGNMWCFHREGQAVYYFDHDSRPALTLVFKDVETYLNALMVLNIAGDDDDAAEAVLRARLGDETVEKWRY
jgi:SMI1 / KNR4 family (SUKH-1)